MKYLDYEGLTYLWNKIKTYITSKHFAGSTADGGAANKAVSIPFGQVDSTSTSTAFTATVDGITELRDGVCVYLRNDVVSSAANCTLNINGLGAKPIYVSQAAASRMSTQFDANYTELFVYNSSRVEGGCWDLFYGYDSNANTIGYDIRDYAIRKPVKSVLYRYQFLFTCMDGTLLPANSDNNVTAATHVLTKESFNPFGQVYYYNSTTTVNAGANAASGTLQSQSTYVTPDFRYSFNTASTLVANNDIYIKCIPQPDGSAILADNPIVFALPTYEDGFIYKRLGKAYDAYRIILEQDKPVYYYKDGIKLWTGYNLQEGVMVTDEFTKKDSGVTSDVRVKSVGGKTVVWNQCFQSGGTDSFQWNNDGTSMPQDFSGKTGYEYDTEGRGAVFDIIPVGHKVLYILSLKADSITSGSLRHSIRYHDAAITIDSTELIKSKKVIDTINEGDTYYSLRSFTDFTATGVTCSTNVFDLTQMFGTGNEPSTVEEFERMFPEDSYAYDAGRIVNVAMTGMKSLDADGNDLDSAELDVTTLTGVADGGSTSEIIFPNGMNGIGDVRDEIDLVNGRAVKRIGVVDMGTLTWESLGNNAFSSSNIDGLKTVASNQADTLKLCLKYPQSGISKASTSMDDKTMNNRANATPKVVVKDTTYSDATTFKIAMSGVMLYYELATPIEYTLDTTPSCVMSVVKGGKEMILPYNASEPQCAPAKVIEEYKASGLSDKDLKNLATTAFVQGEISSQLGNIETLLAAI